MTEQKRYGPFRNLILLGSISSGLLLSSSCATAHTPMQGTGDSAEHTKFKTLSLNVKAELSSPSVASGTLAFLTVEVPKGFSPKELSPKEYSKKTLSGNFEGIDLPFFPLSETSFGAVLGIPYEHSPGPAVVKLYAQDGAQQIPLGELEFKVIEGGYSSEVLKVDGRRVQPTRKKDLLRIAKEQEEIGEIYRKVTPLKYWRGPFTAPITSQITSAFGTRRVYNGKLKNFHSGVDLRAAMRTPIYSAAPGKVVLAKNLFYTGNTVILDHGYGIITLYAHMSRLKVKKGDDVVAHQLVGLSGKTGRVNGPHLHWQAVVHKVKVNPFGLVEVMQ